MKAVKKCWNYLKEFNMKEFLNRIPSKMVLPLFVAGGLAVGLGAYIIYASKAYSYLSSDPSVCINCHVMIPYYQTWSRSSHTHWAKCTDCHLPQNNIFAKAAFEVMDGAYHTTVFTLGMEPQVIRPRNASNNVIMENCIRCHTQLNTAFVKTGMITYSEAKKGKGRACWDCHTEVPHTRVSSLSSSPNAIMPSSESTVPEWLKNIMKKI